jgi:hypothetical protein
MGQEVGFCLDSQESFSVHVTDGAEWYEGARHTMTWGTSPQAEGTVEAKSLRPNCIWYIWGVKKARVPQDKRVRRRELWSEVTEVRNQSHGRDKFDSEFIIKHKNYRNKKNTIAQ